MALLILCLTASAFAQCEFGRLLSHLARGKGKIQNETLEEIAASEAPFSPLENDISMSASSRHPFARAFAHFVDEGISPARWGAIRADARAILAERQIESATRAQAETETAWLPYPQLLRRIPASGVRIRDRLQPHTVFHGEADEFFVGYVPVATADTPTQFFRYDGRHETAESLPLVIKPSSVAGEHRDYVDIQLLPYRERVVAVGLVEGARASVEVRDLHTSQSLHEFPGIRHPENERRNARFFRKGSSVVYVSRGHFRKTKQISSDQWNPEEQREDWAHYAHANQPNGVGYAATLTEVDSKTRLLKITNFETGATLLERELPIPARKPSYHQDIATTVSVVEKSAGGVLAAIRMSDAIHIVESHPQREWEIKLPKPADGRAERPFDSRL